MVSRVIPVDSFDLVIFGGTGDLARRKILPGLYRRFLAGQMTATSRIIGAARADLTEAAYRAQVAASIAEFVPKARHDAEPAPADDKADQAVGIAELVLQQRRQQHHRREIEHPENDDQKCSDGIVAIREQSRVEARRAESDARLAVEHKKRGGKLSDEEVFHGVLPQTKSLSLPKP